MLVICCDCSRDGWAACIQKKEGSQHSRFLHLRVSFSCILIKWHPMHALICGYSGKLESATMRSSDPCQILVIQCIRHEPQSSSSHSADQSQSYAHSQLASDHLIVNPIHWQYLFRNLQHSGSQAPCQARAFTVDAGLRPAFSYCVQQVQ
jgi:hypothetical protein